MKIDHAEISRETVRQYKQFINPSLARLIQFFSGDVVEYRAGGIFVEDLSGKKYIDCLGGYGVFSCGHSHPKILKAVHAQLDLMPLSSRVLFSEQLAKLSEQLAGITPGDLKFSFLCNSGAEAVEGALKLARLSTGRQEVIAMEGAFHGKTLGALSVSGREIYKKFFRPLIPKVRHIPFGDLESLEREISSQTAAVILEPIQGEGGIVLPPDGYLQGVREICSAVGALLILDEIQTGLGRTGKLFACEHYHVAPDIMILAKALGGGIMPIGAFIATPRVWKAFIKKPLLHTSTFGGNPLACSAALAALQVIREENLAKRSEEMGSYLVKQLKVIQVKYPRIIAEVRGKGLMIGVELVKEGYGVAIFPEMLKNGVLTAFTLNNPKVVRFEPPLIITKDQIDKVVEVFENAIRKASGLIGRIGPLALKIGQSTGLISY